MPGLSVYSRNLVLDLLFGPTVRGVVGDGEEVPEAYWVAMVTEIVQADQDGTSLVEPTPVQWTGYERFEIPNTPESFPRAIAGSKSHTVDILFPEVAAGNGATLVGAALLDAPTGGNVWISGVFQQRNVGVGVAPRFPAGSIVFSTLRVEV